MKRSDKLFDMIRSFKTGRLLLLLGGTLLIAGSLLMLPGQEKEDGKTEMQLLKSEKAYLEAAISLAKTDSIGLLVDLHDSVIYLQLKGVKLHQVPLNRLKKEAFFKEAGIAVDSLTSGPFFVERQLASVEKEPVILMNAPKDTAEAAKSVYIPDTLNIKPVYVSLLLEDRMKLIIREKRKEPIRPVITQLKARVMAQTVIRLQWVVGPSLAGHLPALVVEVPEKEGEAIYRALPARPQVVVRW